MNRIAGEATVQAARRRLSAGAALVARRVRPAAALLLAIGLLFSDLAIDATGAFGLSDRADEATSRAAGLISGPLYGWGWPDRPGQAAIVIVALDQDFVDAQGGVWPTPYSAIQGVVEDVARAGPKAIFLDLHYDQPGRTAAGWPDVVGIQALANSFAEAGRHGAPVLIGPVSDKQPLLAPLAASATQVGLTSADDRPFAYSLTDIDGERPMAATELYRIWTTKAGQRQPDLRIKTLAIDWGFGASAWMEPLVAKADSRCIAPTVETRFTKFFGLLKRAAAPKMLGDTDKSSGLVMPCPYFDSVPAAWLKEEVVQRRLKNSIVLVGSTVPWIRDQASTPLLGEVPGVMVHAMALDNLIQNGAGATRYPAEVANLDTADWVQAALMLAGFVVIWRWSKAKGKTEARLNFRERSSVWGGVAAAGVAIAVMMCWPLFKLIAAALAGGIAVEAWGLFQEHSERNSAAAPQPVAPSAISGEL